MDSLRTGSDELVYIETEKVSLTIKGRASHPIFQNVEIDNGDAVLKVFCNDTYEIDIKGNKEPGVISKSPAGYSGQYVILPLFFEQQIYDLYIEAYNGHKVSFWHDNLNVRNKITPASRHTESLFGSINFGNEIGFSDLVIKIDGLEYLRVTVEVFPTKISYQNDYKAIVADVTAEVYNIVFDFLKKTYLGYNQSDRQNSSPVEFYAVIRKIYLDFLKAVDMILAQPHHILKQSYEIMPAYKTKKIDNRGIKWLGRHTKTTAIENGTIIAEKTLGVKKQITYDTKENRLTKYILQSTCQRLTRFMQNYLNLQRQSDHEVICQLNGMINNLKRLYSTSFLAEVNANEANTGMSLVFSMAPGYRELYKYYLMLLHGLDISGDVFNISVKDIALLYEYWCFIKLNSLMKERYQLVSQDIIKVRGNGLFVSLVKGTGSKVIYLNPDNGEQIELRYNPTSSNKQPEQQTPTVSQKPDNVLSLKKHKMNGDAEYEYVFDAKYRINPSLRGTYYHENICETPGPQEDDINTMHRYRDAIVYNNGIGANSYKRAMFGAYILFPYGSMPGQLEEYKNHRFFKSIEKVNIGGLPFLPSATSMVADFLDELINDSADSAFERATLPKGIEEKLAKTNWDERDVLIGTLSRREQLDDCLKYHFYHVPVNQIKDSALPIRYVAIYQSKEKFNDAAGITWYGEVTQCLKCKRREITEIPKNSDELYYRFEIKEWKKLTKTISIKEMGPKQERKYTTLFLLEHSEIVPELWIRSEEEYRFYSELKRAVHNTEINDETANVGFMYNGQIISFHNDKIVIIVNKKIVAEYSVKSFMKSPSTVLRRIQQDLSYRKRM